MIVNLSRKLVAKLKNRQYREAYVEENVKTGIAYQIRALRDQRGWSQKRLAEELGKPPSVVCRIEDPDYGKLSVQTLLEVAAAFDVGLVVRYVNFPRFVAATRDVTPKALEAESFAEEQFRPQIAAMSSGDAWVRASAAAIPPQMHAAQIITLSDNAAYASSGSINSFGIVKHAQ